MEFIDQLIDYPIVPALVNMVSIVFQNPGKVGRIGDKILIIRSKGRGGSPTLEIMQSTDVKWRTKGRFSELPRDTIIYKD